MNPWTASLLGLALGIRHATDPDHVVAISTIITETRSLWRSIRTGLAWGLGHAVTLTLAGGLILVLDLDLPPAAARWLEGAVGVMLIMLGIGTLRRHRRYRLSFHPHHHDDGHTHVHFHSHHHGRRHGENHHGIFPVLTRSGWRATLVGAVHGLAGSSSAALAAAAAMGGSWSGVIFIANLGAGSILGMALVTAALAIPFLLTGGSTERARSWVTLAAGAAGCGFGLWMLIAAFGSWPGGIA